MERENCLSSLVYLIFSFKKYQIIYSEKMIRFFRVKGFRFMHKELSVSAGIRSVRGAFYVGLIAFFCTSQGVIDDRYRDPVLNHQVFVSPDPETCTIFLTQLFVESAHHASNQYGKEVGLFDIGPIYTLKSLDNALLQSGRIQQSLIPTYWQAGLTQAPYNMVGRLQTEGITFHWYHDLSDHWAFGVRGEGLHASARMELVRDPAFDRGFVFGPGDRNQLQILQEEISEALGVEAPIWDAYMLGDLEVYARLYTAKPYAYKCRYVDAGIALGLIVPAAPHRDINNPASILMGGNRHWGMFLEGSVDAIVRHDIRAGFLARYQQRFSRVDLLRVPTSEEALPFGAVVGDIRVSPGPVFMFAPYLIKENLRDGFGMRVGYTLVKQFKDCFADRRVDQSVPINFAVLRETSEWGLDYVTLGFLYDFAYDKVERNFEPVISITVDAPVDFIVNSRAGRTWGVALSMEASF